MWKYAALTAAALVVIAAGLVGSAIGAATVLGDTAIAISLGLALLVVSVVIAVGWTGAELGETKYW